MSNRNRTRVKVAASLAEIQAKWPLVSVKKKPDLLPLPYIGNFSRWEILAKTTLGRRVKFSLSPIFAISRTLNEDVS